MRADENAIADTQAFVKRGEILDLAVVPDEHICIDVNVFSDVAILPDACPLSDLGPVPHRGTVSDLRLSGHLRGRMDSQGHGGRAGMTPEL